MRSQARSFSHNNAHPRGQVLIVHPEDTWRKSKRLPAYAGNFGDSGDWDWTYFGLKLTTIVFSISMGKPLRRKGS